MDHYHSLAAFSHLDITLDVWPRDADSLLLAARLARRLGKYADAGQFLARYQEVRGDDEDLTLEQVLLRAERGELDDVVRFGQALLNENHPASSLILEAFARGYMRIFRAEDASACCKLWQEREPSNPQAHFLEGILHEQSNQTSDALDCYRQTLQIDPKLDEAREHMVSILVQLRQAEEALPHIQYLLGHSDSTVLHLRLAQALYLLGQQAEAAQTLDNLLTRQPNYAPALAERGKVALLAGQFPEAEKWLREAAELQPGVYETHHLLYQCLVRRGAEAARDEQVRMKQIEDDLRNLEEITHGKIQRTPHDPALHYQLGMIALRSGAVQDGLRWLDSAT
jgi:tetratricopeptide (TPR) repeat protein